MTGPLVGGLDGCAAGWVLVTVPTAGNLAGAGADGLDVAVVADLETGRMAAAAIDIPIGLARSAPRACDVAGRRDLPRGL